MKLIDIINEESTPINQELSDKDIKKCKVLWGQFKNGAVIINNKKYRYELRDEYQIMRVPSNPYPIIEIQGTFENSIRLYDVQENGHIILLDYGLENRIYSEAKAKVKKKFINYNVHLSL